MARNGEKSGSGRNMGLFNIGSACFKRKYRWMFFIKDVCGTVSDSSYGTNVLPPSKGSRPSISFKEIEAQHVSETVYFPGRPDWKPISLTLYDFTIRNQNRVFEWLKLYYRVNGTNVTIIPSVFESNIAAQTGIIPASGSGLRRNNQPDAIKIPEAELILYDGCGNAIERWVFENVWPQSVEFGELDMQSSEVVTVDVTLRYDRAYIENKI
jgi:hypothetical protein